MLPGFRFLFAAIVLSVSILIFGLGAAALLRAAHEEFASIPARRVAPEPVFTQQAETPAPTLAMLRVEPSPQDGSTATLVVPVRAEEPPPEAVPVPRVEVERLAALIVEEPPKPEQAKPEATTAAAPANTPDVSEPSTEIKIAALDATPAAAREITAAPTELIAMPAMTDGSVRPAPVRAATKTAALGNAPTSVEVPAQSKRSAAKPDRSEIRKKQRAERAKERRRLAARRARLAAQQSATTPAQQPGELFGDTTQQAQPAAAARRRR